ncbi:S8 family serine peptidase [Paenibacillus dokdonensis]|uniref:S8 family serine peptidase n=1 Tax=Paenibacillus dokdonensis TaxID=2567944 RepID=A0ABU6GQ68_9BACL|nr:S8 family serine peptidase [Paenibacillus dokdonensis]MEC0241272.1 S8 family serine peptidase [Paenibacillus dokdonensis]
MKKLRDVSRLLVVLLTLSSLLFPNSAFAFDSHAELTDQALSPEVRAKMQQIVDQNKFTEGQQPVLHSDLQNLTGDKEISVIVELSEAPVALAKGMSTLEGKSFTAATEQNTKQKIVRQQQSFISQLSKNSIKANVGFSYNYTFNGLSLKLKAGQVEQLLKMDGVQMVEPDVEVHALGEESSKLPDSEVNPMLSTSNPFLGIPDVWKLGYTGQGVKVGVVDTGIDYYHPELKDIYKGGHNFITQVVDGSDKGYARTRGDDPYETTPRDRPANRPLLDPTTSEPFNTEHGTHVAGIIAAQGKNPYGIKGLAPSVELHAYRVLGAYGSGSNSGVIAGIDKAVEEHMDVINLSLGGTTNSQVASDAIAINNAVLAGTIACVATGNSGPNRGTIGSPSTAAFAISVGNSTVPEKTMAGKATVTLSGAQTVTPYTMNLMSWKFGTEPKDILTGTYDVVAIPGVGQVTDYSGVNVAGKVALVARGDIAFVDKIAAAKSAGAVAVIIHNSSGGSNTPGPAGVLLGDIFSSIPTFDMSYTDGNALRTALAKDTGTVTFGGFTAGTTLGDDINSSSSRGPANPVFDIKPDVSAPGTDIMSSVPAYGKDYADEGQALPDYSESYDRFTGTSMATPHVAAVAALLKSEHPDWTPFDIKVAISNTAKQLDVTKYDVFAQGSGRVQPLQAATTEALAYESEPTTFSNKTYDNVKGTITFGNVSPNANNPMNVTRSIVVKNLTGSSSDYTVSVQTTKAATGTLASSNVTVDKSSFTLTGEQNLTVTLNVPKGTGTAGNEIQGYVKITNGKTNLILPFAANFAPPTGLKSFTIDSNHISPNGDGKLDSTSVRYEFYNRQSYTYIELFDLNNLTGGYYGDGSIGWILNTNSTTTGAKTLNFNGNYHPWGKEGAKLDTPAPESVYAMQITTLNSTGTEIVASGILPVPVYVKTSTPKFVSPDNLNVTGSNLKFSGSIDDSYVKFGPVVEDEFDLVYDVNDNLHMKYELSDSNDKLISSQPVTLDQKGNFNITSDGLTTGTYKLKLIVDDAASNHAEKVVQITSADPVLSGITVTPDKLNLAVGSTADLTVKAQYMDADGKPFPVSDDNVTSSASYTDYDSAVINVDNNGKVTAVDVGSTTITVAYGGKSTSVPVTITDETTTPVEPELKSITVSPDRVALNVGMDAQLVVTAAYSDGSEKDVTSASEYSAADTGIATVSNTGKVTAVEEGETTVTISYEGKTYEVLVKVTDEPTTPVEPELTSITVSPDRVALKVGKDTQLAATAVYSDGSKKEVTSDAVYSAADTGIATVSDTGKVTAVKEGETTVTVSYEGKTYEVSVKVTDETTTPVEPELKSITVSPDRVALKVGQDTQLAATAVYSDGSKKEVTSDAKYSVPGTSIVTVSNTGKVTAVGAGQTTITVSYEGKSYDVSVTVTDDSGTTNPGTPSYPNSPSVTAPSSPSTPVPTGVKVKAGTLLVTKKDKDTTYATISVSSEALIDQLKDLKATFVTLDLTDVSFNDYNGADVIFNKATADKLLASGKGLILTGHGFTIRIPADALADFIGENGFKFILSVVDPGNGEMKILSVNQTTVVSQIVTIGNEKGTLSHPIEIDLNPSSRVNDLQKVGVYQQDENGKWVYVGHNATHQSGNIQLLTSKLGSFELMEQPISFDDIQTHWAKHEIEVIAAQHVTNGKSESKFVPNDTITRAEFVALLDRIFGQEKAWSQYATMAGASDILGREDMVVLMVNAMKADLKGEEMQLNFKDKDQISANAQAAVAYAVDKGLINGMSNNTFAPDQSSTRAQIATILYRLMKLTDKI